jgi:hypothetical protein
MLPAIIGAISVTIYKSHRCLWCTNFFPQQCYLITISIPVASAQNNGRNTLTFYKVFFFQLKYYVTTLTKLKNSDTQMATCINHGAPQWQT